MMGGYGPMMGWSGFGWAGMLFGGLLWLALLGVLVWAVVRMTQPRPERGQETPLEILKRRYARGEITGAEFEEARRALE